MKKINIIGMPIKYGCFVEGADLSYEVLKTTLSKTIENNILTKIDEKNIDTTEFIDDTKIRYINAVMSLNERLRSEVFNTHKNNNFPLVIGGDHSLGIGSVKADLDYYKGDVSVIWVDAHLDIHSNLTTPSGNIHGMPLRICIGDCDNRFDIGTYKLNPTDLYYVGTRSYEKEEKDYIDEKGICYYKDTEVTTDNINNIVNEIKSKIKTKYVHISLDLDIMSVLEFSSVNVEVNKTYSDDGGVSLKDVIKLIDLLLSNLNVCTLDIVEYNPLLDKDKLDLLKIESILKVINNNLKSRS